MHSKANRESKHKFGRVCMGTWERLLFAFCKMEFVLVLEFVVVAMVVCAFHLERTPFSENARATENVR